MQGKHQYREKLFLSFQLSDRIPQDNFYRRLNDLLELKWLYKATEHYYGTEGQRSIDPVVFIKFMLIGYLENLSSDRRIITMVSMRMDMLYFLGYDIDEPLPLALYPEQNKTALWRSSIQATVPTTTQTVH